MAHHTLTSPSILAFLSCFCLLLSACTSYEEQVDLSLFNIGGGLACDLAKCLRGTCVNSSSFPFYKCDCNAGWKSPFGTSWLPCILPNCSIDLNCANRSNPHSAPPPLVPRVGGVFDICSFPVCGNGLCIQDTSGNHSRDGYECKCDTGYVNLRNKTDGYCIHKCSIGADCTNLNLPIGGTAHTPPPPLPPSPPPPVSSNQNSHQGQVKNSQSGLMIAATLVLVGLRA